LVTPLDLVKCNVQNNPEIFPTSVTSGLKQIYNGREEIVKKLGLSDGGGLRSIVKGWGPTFVGYSIQGAGKYGFYEYFKYKYSNWIQNDKYRDLINAGASATAEIIADIGLCPLEAVKVRIQTSSFANGLSDGLPKFYAENGLRGLYAGLIPLWCRQVPYTVTKFVAFERIAEELYKLSPRKKDEMNKLEQMSIIFTSGYIAGIFCAIISNPADVMVSKINQLNMNGNILEKIRVIYSGTGEKRGIGFAGLWKGLGTRIIMIGTLTALQWFLYGGFKVIVGLPTPGGEH
ncbi:unnamed protein product, partial [Didymodactylos carnosus]